MTVQRCVITWYCQAVKLSKRSSQVISFGICSYQNNVAFIAIYNPHATMNEESLKPLIIHDVYVEDGECEDACHCLNVDCPLNKADLDYFKRKLGVRSDKKLQDLHILFEQIKRDLKLTVRPLGENAIFEKPPIYITVQKRK